MSIIKRRTHLSVVGGAPRPPCAFASGEPCTEPTTHEFYDTPRCGQTMAGLIIIDDEWCHAPAREIPGFGATVLATYDELRET